MGEERCVDVIKTFVPTEDVCETCGSKPLTCRPGDPELPDILHFDGSRKLRIEFTANGDRSEEFRAFEFLITCVTRSFFFSEFCVTPDEETPSGRLTRRNVENLVNAINFLSKYRLLAMIVSNSERSIYS